MLRSELLPPVVLDSTKLLKSGSFAGTFLIGKAMGHALSRMIEKPTRTNPPKSSLNFPKSSAKTLSQTLAKMPVYSLKP